VEKLQNLRDHNKILRISPTWKNQSRKLIGLRSVNLQTFRWIFLILYLLNFISKSIGVKVILWNLKVCENYFLYQNKIYNNGWKNTVFFSSASCCFHGAPCGFNISWLSPIPFIYLFCFIKTFELKIYSHFFSFLFFFILFQNNNNNNNKQ